MNLKRILNLFSNEDGFMGPTHTLSAVAFYLLLLAFFPAFIYETILKTNHPIIIIGSLFVISGFALFPDFDNTRSTVISTLGIVGKGISKIMRGSAVGLYFMTKTERDDPSPDPHRGFWHTLFSSFVIGGIVAITTSLPLPITIPIIEKESRLGFLFAVLYIFISYQLTLVSFFGSYMKNFKKSILGKLAIFFTGLIFSLSVLFSAPTNISYHWISYCAILGYMFHIIGDTMTVAGTPLLWPLKRKGKRWWVYRIMKIRAGGTVEKNIITPCFVVIIFFSLIKIFFMNT